MVRALLDGSKTQTRRVVVPQPQVSDKGHLMGEWLRKPLGGLLRPRLQDITIHSPYGQPGDRLYVRERWAAGACADSLAPRDLHPGTWLRDNGGLWFEADGAEPAHPISPRGKWRQGMFMPKWASRILLGNVGVRVERVQDISEADAYAEGTFPGAFEFDNGEGTETAVESYRYLWDSLNAARGYGWEINPFVWVVDLGESKNANRCPLRHRRMPRRILPFDVRDRRR
jgi:hypothetical protein